MLQGTSADTGSEDSQYEIERSLRFSKVHQQAYLDRGFNSGNRRKWTFSFWIKRGKLGLDVNNQEFVIFSTSCTNTACNAIMQFTQDDQFGMFVGYIGAKNVKTTRRFRDTSSWYHIVTSFDVNQSEAVRGLHEDKWKLWVNGVEETAFDTDDRSTLSADDWGISIAQNHRIGNNGNLSRPFSGQLANVEFIDGQFLGPAAFGEFNSAGLWVPKAFNLPAPNNNTTWSGAVTSSTGSYDGSYPATSLFNDVYDNNPGSSAEPSVNTGDITWTPVGGLAFTQEVAIMSASNIPFKLTLNDGRTFRETNPSSTGASPSTTVLYNGSGTITKIETLNNGSNWTNWRGIRVDGKWLVDGKQDATTYNNNNKGVTWSTNGTVTGNSTSATKTFDLLFDNKLDTFSEQSGNDVTLAWTPSPAIEVKKSMRIYFAVGGNPNDTVVNGDATAINVDPKAGWTEVEVPSGGMNFSKLEVKRGGSGVYARAAAIEIDGNILIDSARDNSFRLKFEGTTPYSTIGDDTFHGDLDSASGGLPFYNTTDTYGATKGSGYRTDSTAGTTDGTGLILALPGDVLTDEHDHVNTGSSANTITNNGTTTVSTTSNRFYGSSLRFDGGQRLSAGSNSDFVLGGGNWCIEFWMNPDDVSGNEILIENDTGTGGISIQKNGDDIEVQMGSLFDPGTTLIAKQWQHVAVTRSGSTTTLFLNGISQGTSSVDAGSSQAGFEIGQRSNGSNGYSGFLQDIRVYKGQSKYTANFKPPVRNSFLPHRFTGLSHGPNFTEGVTLSVQQGAIPSDQESKLFAVGSPDSDWSKTIYATGVQNGTNEWKISLAGASRLKGDIRIYLRRSDASGVDGNFQVKINDGSYVDSGCAQNGTTWFDAGYLDDLEHIQLKSVIVNNSSGLGVAAIEVNGTVVQDGLIYQKREIDQLTDTPTSYLPTGGDDALGGATRGNYCTWNPIATTGPTFKNSNLDVASATSSAVPSNGTFGMSSGKWYWEIDYTGGNDGIAVGITKNERLVDFPGNNEDSWAFMSYSGKKGHNATQVSYGTAFTPTNGSGHGTVVGIALDVDARKIWWRIDGTWQASGNPATGANAAYTDLDQNVTYFPTCGPDSSGVNNAEYSINAGQRPFEDTAPSGFKCLCVQNLDDTFTGDNINNPSKFFDVRTYIGTGSALTLPADFSTDLSWMKRRNQSSNTQTFDRVNGYANTLATANNSVIAAVSMISATTDTSYTLGTDGSVNEVNDTYVHWMWDAGSAASGANTDGTINIADGDQWVNNTCGFSITKYTGTGADATFGHGLSSQPQWIIIKKTSQSGNWTCQHKSATLGSGRMILDEDYANDTTNADTYWNSTAPTNEVISIGDHANTNGSTKTHICYAWAEIPGYSSFGGYTGNASTNGPFVFTGFEPAFVLWKRTDAVENWSIIDSARSPINVANDWLTPHRNDAESADNAAYAIDILSNGFKVRASAAAANASNGTYLYCAFAEHPFKTARAK